mmetsp:Transcript_75298/g.152253  ORF Transcript_75298/g.152253 Transcript_75298/m.152253 type:complete len:203 (-) Transcript_75298:73-681(-)
MLLEKICAHFVHCSGMAAVYLQSPKEPAGQLRSIPSSFDAAAAVFKLFARLPKTLRQTRSLEDLAAATASSNVARNVPPALSCGLKLCRSSEAFPERVPPAPEFRRGSFGEANTSIEMLQDAILAGCQWHPGVSRLVSQGTSVGSVVEIWPIAGSSCYPAVRHLTSARVSASSLPRRTLGSSAACGSSHSSLSSLQSPLPSS